MHFVLHDEVRIVNTTISNDKVCFLLDVFQECSLCIKNIVNNIRALNWSAKKGNKAKDMNFKLLLHFWSAIFHWNHDTIDFSNIFSIFNTEWKIIEYRNLLITRFISPSSFFLRIELLEELEAFQSCYFWKLFRNL